MQDKSRAEQQEQKQQEQESQKRKERNIKEPDKKEDQKRNGTAGICMEKIRRHPLLLVAVWGLAYNIAFMTIGHLVPPRHVVHIWLDDIIPFSEWFVIPYFCWFVWIPAVVLYCLRKYRKEYYELCFVLLSGMSLCAVFYAFFPNCLDFRHAVPERNILCRLVNILYEFDPATNVFPSVHVGVSVGAWIVMLGSKELRKKTWLQILNVCMMVLVSMSTVMIKQHSAADVFAGAMLNIILFLLYCRTKKGQAFLERFL